MGALLYICALTFLRAHYIETDIEKGILNAEDVTFSQKRNARGQEATVITAQLHGKWLKYHTHILFFYI